MDQMPVSTLSHGDIITPTHFTAAAPDAGTRWKNESTARTLKSTSDASRLIRPTNVHRVNQNPSLYFNSAQHK